ncbi:MAG: glycoside hydrolase family 15 protein, partial [Bdellovibrionia bacterium]
MHIEDYGLIGNCRTAALISREGSMDWLCLPRFDSPACFAALIGNSENGRWLIQPAMPFRSSWKYRKHSLILETEFITNTGRVILTDLMPIRVRQPCIIRRVRGMEGRVSMHMEYVLRFDYGSLIPWVRKIVGGGIDAMVGPDHVRLRTQVPLQHQGFTHRSEFSVNAGEEIYFTMIWTPSHEEDIPDIAYPSREIEDTHLFWKNWASKCTYHGPWKEEVLRSLITLKALTYQPTGGIIAAPTTSLPEMIGGSRNWDYRYCWLRDATFTLYALLSSGYREEAEKWREWLIRAVAGIPSQMNIVHGIAGEHRLPEIELPWLSGYENSRPVRMGNLAYQQYQLDVYGELMDTLHLGRKNNLNASPESWDLQKKLLEYLEGIWKEPDSGVWESRGPEKHFVYSKVMAWVAMDRGIKAVEMFKRDGSVDRWRKIRDEIHQEVCQKGFD